MKKNFTITDLSKFLLSCNAVKVTYSTINNILISMEIINPSIEELEFGTICIRNHKNEYDIDFIYFCLADFNYNEYNSNDSTIVLNHKSKPEFITLSAINYES